MEKIEANKLLKIILSGHLNTKGALIIILSDEAIFQKCAEKVVTKSLEKKTKFFAGNNALEDYVHDVRQNNLFEPVQNAFIVLDEKFSLKKNAVYKLPILNNHVCVFGKTSLRYMVSEKTFPESFIYLCYSPKDSDRKNCATLIADYYLSDQNNDGIKDVNLNSNLQIRSLSDLASHALELYNNDLYRCLLHFERMKKGNLNFEAAKLDDVSLTSFDIIQTILKNDLSLLDKRLQQYCINGKEPSAILYGLIYFLKQLVAVHVQLSEHGNMTLALKNAKIPYPAQDNIKTAIQIIPFRKIEHFFSICAEFEIKLRENKNSNLMMFHELKYLLT